MAKMKKAPKSKKETIIRDLPSKPQRDMAVKGGGNKPPTQTGSSPG